VAVEQASPSAATPAPATPASIHILTHAIAMHQSHDISVSGSPRPVVSPSGNRSGSTHSVVAKKQQIARPIASPIQQPRVQPRAVKKVNAVSVTRHAAKSHETAPALQPAHRGFAAPRPARAVRPAAVVAPPTDRPLKNTRAMLQLGMLFGFAYLGFLAIWFWSPRFRRSVRRPLRL
jgi:hypothetical protein